MNDKRCFFSEIAYLAGIFILAYGTALMEKADFGMSMVVSPAYLLHLKISAYLPFFTFGMAEYCLQAVILIALGLIMHRFRIMYLFSFVTAVFYGFVLDGMISLASLLPAFGIPGRCFYFAAGMILCAVGVSLLFHTYIAPEAYELFVKEISEKFGTDIGKTKTVYDCTSCAFSILLSFLFFGFGHFEGVKAGTIVCACFNGFLIGTFGKIYDRHFEFRDGLKFRKYFK